MQIEHLRLTTHDEWLIERRKSLGASDAAAALGFSTWKSPFALFSEIQGWHTVEENIAMRAGSHMEEFVASEFKRETGLAVEIVGNSCEPYHIFRRGNLHATPDRWVVEDGQRGVLELKYSLRSWVEIPLQYQIQLYQQMWCCGCSFGYVCGYVGGKLMYQRYEFDADLWEPIRIKLENFFDDCKRGIAPPVDGHQSTSEALRAINPSQESVDLPSCVDEIFLDLSLVKESISQLEAEKAEYENRIKALLIDHRVGKTSAWTATYKPQTRSGKCEVAPEHVETLKAAGIPFVEKHATQTRVLRITKNKGE